MSPTRTETVYYASYKAGADPNGRIYVAGLQNIKGSLRHRLCHEDYHEVDTEHPCICAQTVLLSMARFFDHKKSRHRVGVLVHDSMLVERTNQNPLPEGLLREAQTRIKDETGLDVKLVEIF